RSVESCTSPRHCSSSRMLTRRLSRMAGRATHRVSSGSDYPRLVATDLLTVKGLRRAFGGLVVLDDVNLKLKAGKACAVVGPNGAGKTTLLRCVAGTLKPDS